MIESDFREWTLDKIDEAFGLLFVDYLPPLTDLVSFEYDAAENEQIFLNKLSCKYRALGGENWNEAELENKVISRMLQNIAASRLGIWNE